MTITKPEVNSRDVIQSDVVCVILSDYMRHLNQMWAVAHGSRNRQPSWWNVPNLLIMKIQEDGVRHIDFFKCRYTTGNFTMAFSLHVVESVSDRYNF